VLHLAVGTRAREHVEVPDPRLSLLYGAILGSFSAIILVLGTTTDLKSHWVWVILTLYVLADPVKLVTPKKMFHRILGTFAGFAVVSGLALAGIPDPVLQILALPALWLCVFAMVTKQPYWQYTLFLTMAVVLMNSHEVNTLLLDGERFGFTLLGAALSVLAALLVNLVYFRRRGVTAPPRS